LILCRLFALVVRMTRVNDSDAVSTDLAVPGGCIMAKALLGYVGRDNRVVDANQRLRQRIADLEAVVLRLQAENDALTARLHDGELLVVPHDITARATAEA